MRKYWIIASATLTVSACGLFGGSGFDADDQEEFGAFFCNCMNEQIPALHPLTEIAILRGAHDPDNFDIDDYSDSLRDVLSDEDYAAFEANVEAVQEAFDNDPDPIQACGEKAILRWPEIEEMPSDEIDPLLIGALDREGCEIPHAILIITQ